MSIALVLFNTNISSFSCFPDSPCYGLYMGLVGPHLS